MREFNATEWLLALQAASKRPRPQMIETRRKSCPRCQQRSDDGLLCHPCCQRVIKALAELIEWWPDLWVTITRQAKLAKMAELRGSGTEQPLAFNDPAADLANEIRHTLVGWVRITVEDLGAPCPRDYLSSMCLHLEQWLPRMRGHEACVEMADELIGLPLKVRKAIDFADERAKIPIGPCPEVYDNKPCGGTVVAVLFTDEHQAPVMRCPKCDAEWPSWQWRRAAKRISERMEA